MHIKSSITDITKRNTICGYEWTMEYRYKYKTMLPVTLAMALLLWPQGALAMHMADGVLSPPVIGTGWLVTIFGTAIALHRLTPESIPRVAIMASAFFITSFIHIPLPPTSVHLVLSGLGGLLLGWGVFPAFLMALLLQAFHGFGGYTVLGVNTTVIALPGVIVYHLLHHTIRPPAPPRRAACWGATAAAIAVAIMASLLTLCLLASGEAGEFRYAAWTAAAAHAPLLVIEAVVTGFAISFIMRIRPQLLRHPASEDDSPKNQINVTEKAQAHPSDFHASS